MDLCYAIGKDEEKRGRRAVAPAFLKHNRTGLLAAIGHNAISHASTVHYIIRSAGLIMPSRNTVRIVFSRNLTLMRKLLSSC